MKVIGWNKYSGDFEGKPYEGYYLYLSSPHASNVQGVGERVVIEKIRKTSNAYGIVPMLNPGDEVQAVYYDRRGNVQEIII